MNQALITLFHGPGLPFTTETAPLPATLAPGELLVKITLATVCGSDLHTIDGRRGAPTPCVLGHEAVGVVLAGERPGLAPGQRVTWTLADSCGHCPACTAWRLPQKCDDLFKYGHAGRHDGTGLNGCYATHILLRPGTVVFAVPDTLPDALVAPANCALATMVNVLANLPRPCDSALVQGAGLLGLYACALLRARGVARVYCADLSPQRLALVADFGGIPLLAGPADWPTARDRVRAENPGGVDLAVEVAGSSALVPEGIALLRPGGHYVWAGMVHPETRLDLTGEAVLRKCLTIRGVHNYAPEHLEEGLRFLAEHRDRLPFDRLVSPPLPLDRLQDAIDLTRTRQWMRVSVQP